MHLRLEGADALRLHGTRPGTGAASGYAELRADGVYPGTDFVVYGDPHGGIEYDFVLAPGADPRAIRISFAGAGQVRLAPSGDLLIGTIIQRKPFAYQIRNGVRVEVPSRYVVSGQSAGIETGEYDKSQPLVIDPVLTVADLPESLRAISVDAIAADSQGNLYAAGRTAQAADLFVAKLSPSGAVLFSARFGGSGVESDAQLAVDSVGTVYLAGNTDSPDLPVNSGAKTGGGFLARFASDGALTGAVYVGSEKDRVRGLDADGAGIAYVVLEDRLLRIGSEISEASLGFRPGKGAIAVASDGTLLVAGAAGEGTEARRYAPWTSDQLQLLARAEIPGPASQEVSGIGTALDGSVWVAGTVFAASGGDSQVFAVRLNAGLTSMEFSGSFGGSGADRLTGLAADPSGSIYIAGATSSPDLPELVLQRAGAKSGGFVARLDAAGGETMLSGYVAGGVEGIAIDPSGAVWLGGAESGAATLRRLSLADATVNLARTGPAHPGAEGVLFTARSRNSGSEPLGERTVTVSSSDREVAIGAVSGAGWDCAGATCRRADLLAPGQQDPPLNVWASISGSAGGEQAVSALIRAEGDEIAQNNASIQKFAIATGADLILVKSHVGDFVQGQTGAAYRIRVSNIGIEASSGTVTVTETIPQGLTLTGLAGTGWTCAAASCTRADALGPNQTYPDITVTVNVASDAAVTVTNRAAVAGGNDTDTTNNSSEDVTRVLGPDLTVTKTHARNFVPGQQGGTYTVTVINRSQVPTRGTVTVTDTIPTGLTLVSMAGTGWNCTSATCTRGDALAGGALYPEITVTVNAAANAPSTVTNTVTVSGGADTDTSNNSASDVTPVAPGPDLRMTKVHISGTARSGDIVYRLTVTNVGTAAAVNPVTVTDTLPAGLTLKTMAGTGWTCDQNSCTRNDTLAPQASYPAIDVTATSSRDAAASIINTGTVFADGDVSTANNVSSVTTSLVFTDLTVTKTHAHNFVRGQRGTYSIVVNNVGTAQSTGTITVTDTLPASLTLVSITGPGWTCVQLVCTSTDVIGAGRSSPPITLVVEVAGNAPNSVTNTATAAGTDDNPDNNTATDPTGINNPTDLTITKTHAGAFNRGQTNAEYLITVRNSGANPSTGPVTVVDTVPAGMTIASMTGTGWMCMGNACRRSDALAAGQNFPVISVKVDIGQDTAPAVTNTAVVSGGGDSVANNNTAEDPTTIGTANLSITKTHVGNFFRGQQNAVYTVTVTNGGAVATTGQVSVTDTLPTGKRLGNPTIVFAARGAILEACESEATADAERALRLHEEF
ncbi:MAG: DUF11 domain-containing protein, partial [Acidobacteria bacterium]|nr:DUF11 domain-containing protein [Acidobacteriota bacterium]